MAHITCSAVVFALSAMAAGCTTSPIDARGKKPTLEIASSKSAKVVASCIAGKWEDLYRMGTLNVRPVANGFSVMQQDQAFYGRDFPFIADIEERGTGSFTRYFNNAISAKKIDQSVIDCQA